MKKPRIFISMTYMELGGAERALLGLLNAFDTKRVDIDLFINQHTGELMKLIPDKVNLLPERRGYNAIRRPIKTIIKEGQYSVAFARLVAKFKYKRYKRKNGLQRDASATNYTMDEVIKVLPSLYDLGEYDLAISFVDPPHIVQEKVKAKKRIEWIHTDFGQMNLDINKLLPRWASNDYIASISPDITRSFLKAFPSLKDKIILIENIISPQFVRQQAELPVKCEIPEDNNDLSILSIGRFSYPKNFESIPLIMRSIVNAGFDKARWYLIGFGSNESLIRDKIAEAGMEHHVIILGKRQNPYPYIKACDIYVQPSRYEGKSITVREAQILYKPVIITRYDTSGSQINDGVDGIICDMDNDSVAESIINLWNNKELQSEIINYLETHDYGNETEINKLYKILND